MVFSFHGLCAFSDTAIYLAFAHEAFVAGNGTESLRHVALPDRPGLRLAPLPYVAAWSRALSPWYWLSVVGMGQLTSPWHYSGQRDSWGLVCNVDSSWFGAKVVVSQVILAETEVS